MENVAASYKWKIVVFGTKLDEQQTLYFKPEATFSIYRIQHFPFIATFSIYTKAPDLK